MWRLLPLISLGLAACAPGSLAWPGGEEPLRTALWTHDGRYTRVFLSNGHVPCDLPETGRAEAIADVSVAFCREGARHVLLELDHDPITILTVGTDQAYSADGWYLAIEEAYRSSTHELAPRYHATSVTWVEGLGTGGEVTIDHGDPQQLRGSFRFGEARVSGTFRAERCEVDALLFELARRLGPLSCH